MTRNRNRVLSILISVMLIMSMVFSCVPMANAASTDVQSSGGQEIGIYGDVDLNGEVNIRDVTRIQKYATYKVQFTDVQKILADVNQDGRVNVQDATALQRYVLGESQQDVVAGQVATEPDTTSTTEATTSSTEETTSSTEETTSSTEETTSSQEETSSSVPADMVTVNLDVSVIGSSGSRYAVYTFDGVGGESWVDMTYLGSDRFTVELDKNTFTGLVFCRMDGETTENNWDNIWNQTEDLTLDGTLYTITGWGSGFEAKLTGVWSTETPTSSTEETTSSTEETSSSVEETSSSVEETSTSVSETRRVWFRNDLDWSDVSIYAWYMVDSETSVKLADWPGVATTKDGQDNGKDMYYYDLPVEYTTVIFTTNGGKVQTVNITLDDTNNAYYPTGEKGDYNHEVVQAFVYGGEATSTTVEETTTSSVEETTTTVEETTSSVEETTTVEETTSSVEETTSSEEETSTSVEETTTVPADMVTVNLDVSAIGSSGSRYAVYTFGGGNPKVWTDMTYVGEDVFTVQLDKNTFTKLIFVRMNGETTENNWDKDTAWNQTEDLTLDGTLYTVTGWGAELGAKLPGVWSTVEPTTTTVEETTTTEEETTSSEEETSSSVEETTSSVEETSSSEEETSSSVEETTSSVEETTSSVEETTSSVEETTSSVEETSSSVAPTTRRVWFRNDHNWSNVRIYAWYMVDENTSVKLTPWDEIPTITKDGQDNGKDMYYYDLPVEYTNVIFTSNSKKSRTVNITLDDVHNAYYPTEEKDSEGYEYVQAFVYGGETPSTSVEETSSSVEETSSVSADMVTVTLDVTAIGSSGSRYAVYTFGGGNPKVWTDMTNVGGDVFTVQLDKNTFTKLIFVRMNGETTENNWDKDTAWNQTEDLTLDGTLYTVTGWGAELGAKLPGVWSTVEPTTTTVEETTTTEEETTSSEEETSSSVEETTSSVEETSSSEEETSSSVEETTTTVEETTSSVEETTTTVEETSSSVEETTTVEETTSSVEETSSSSTSTTRRVWFRNDHNWSNVRIYAWYMVDESTSVKLTPWEEIPTMTKDGQDNGKDMYYYDLPVEYTNVIFTSNSKKSQTVNITLDDVNNAYYPTEEKDEYGNEYVQAFVYGGEATSTTVEETTTTVEETTTTVEETTSSVEETTSSEEETTTTVEETTTVPADMVTVTLDVSSIGSSGSRYAVYTFGGGNKKVWTDMTNVSGDLFTVQLDKNTFTGLIFCRMDGATTENNWDNVWNQTEDLTLDGTLYTVTGWGTEVGAKLPGTWSTEEPTTTTVEETTSSVEETTSSEEETTSSVEETTTSTTSTTAPVEDQVTLTLVDGTPQGWLADASAVFVLVDNSTSTSYNMEGGAGTWTVIVPASVTDITINRNSPTDGKTWNSWTTTRSTGTTYTATGSGVGSWDGTGGGETTTTPQPSGNTIQFTDNQGWGTVYAYFFDANGNTVGSEWPGTQMGNPSDNGFGQTNYSVSVPSGATTVVFSNGNGAQTSNAELGHTGYYTDGTTDGEGHFVTKFWD